METGAMDILIRQETSEPVEEEGSLQLEFILGGLVVLVLIAGLIWRKLNAPLPIERLPEVARRQRMKGL